MDLDVIKTQQVKKILEFSIPAIIAMVLTSFITIIDGFFTGNYVGKEGIAAINLGLPIVYLYLGLGLMISVGGSVLAGIELGAMNKEKSVAIFNQTIVVMTIVSVVTSLLVCLFFNPILNILHADGVVAKYFRDYYTIMLIELPVMVMLNSFGMFIRGEGNPRYFMIISILNVAGNLVLDAVFAGLLHLGIKGIAYASLLSSSICLICMILYCIRSAKVYQFHSFVLDKQVLRDTLLNGSSEFIGEISMSITMFAYNVVILKTVGVDGVTAFTIVGYVAYIFDMILIGFGQGTSPLISIAFGAKEPQLGIELRKKTNRIVLGAGIVVILLMYLVCGWYSHIFVENREIETMVQAGIHIFVLSFLFSGINTITSFYFTSIGRAKESAVISSMRGLVVLLICIISLPVLFGMTGVWFVAPVTEAVTVMFSLIFIRRSDRILQKQSCMV